MDVYVHHHPNTRVRRKADWSVAAVRERSTIMAHSSIRFILHGPGLVLMVAVLLMVAGHGQEAAAQPSVCVSIHGDIKAKQGAEFPSDGGSECHSDADSRAIAVNGSIASGQDGSHAVAVNGSFAVATTDSRALGVNDSFFITATDGSTATAINSSGAGATNGSTATAINNSGAGATDGSTATAINGCSSSNDSAVHAANGGTEREVNCP